jgi:hypothetical protein
MSCWPAVHTVPHTLFILMNAGMRCAVDQEPNHTLHVDPSRLLLRLFHPVDYPLHRLLHTQEGGHGLMLRWQLHACRIYGPAPHSLTADVVNDRQVNEVSGQQTGSVGEHMHTPSEASTSNNGHISVRAQFGGTQHCFWPTLIRSNGASVNQLPWRDICMYIRYII